MADEADQSGSRELFRSRVGSAKLFDDEPRVRTFPEIRITYSPDVVAAIENVVREYNGVFKSLIEANREWDTDYAYGRYGGGDPQSLVLQIDMAGLSHDTLNGRPGGGFSDLSTVIRSRLFEIENSWAAYRLHAVNLRGATASNHEKKTRSALQELRSRWQRPIALLATTSEKFASMKESEFGRTAASDITDSEVQTLTGFDRLFGPDSFEKYLQENGNECEYLLYVRASHSAEALRDGNRKEEDTLLRADPVRRVVKAHSLTFNIDNPAWSPTDARRINDSKAYLPRMGLAFEISTVEELESASRKLGEGRLRAKPTQGSYGCYGHETGVFSNKKFRYRMRQNFPIWGTYLVQREIPPAIACNLIDRSEYAYMDRVFCRATSNGPEFIGGLRLFLPLHSMEAKRGRLHFVNETIVSEIVMEERNASIIDKIAI